jgi:hypothetical protein
MIKMLEFIFETEKSQFTINLISASNWFCIRPYISMIKTNWQFCFVFISKNGKLETQNT